jgi:hypothetical protein
MAMTARNRPSWPQTGPPRRREAAAIPGFIHIPQYLLSIRLRKPVGRAYIPDIPVIHDGNRLRPSGRAEHKENLS